MSDNSTTSYYNALPPQGEPLTPDPTPAPKKMSKGKKWAIGVGALFALGLIGNLGSKAPTVDPTAVSVAVPQSTTTVAGATPTLNPSVQASLDKAAADKAAADKAAADKAAADKAAADKAAADKAAADAAAAKKAADAQAAAEKAAADKAAAEKAAADAMSNGQQQAVAKAESYIEMTAFSRSGLIKQLQFEEFSQADATFAVDHITVDWNAQAAEKAKSYLEMSPFSRNGLIKQLQFEGFTSAQATHGVNAAGL